MIKALRQVLVASLKQCWFYYSILLLIFISGIFLGVGGTGQLRGDQVEELKEYLNVFLQNGSSFNLKVPFVIKEILTTNMVVIVAIYFLGLTIIGIPAMLAMVFFKGYALGFTVNFLIQEKGLQGIILALLAILLPNILYVPALLIGGVASLVFSTLLVRRYLGAEVSIWPNFLCYSGLMLAVLTIALGAGLVGGYLSPVLIKLASPFFI